MSNGTHYSASIKVYCSVGLTQDHELFVKRINLATEQVLSNEMADIEDLSPRVIEQNSANSTIQILCKDKEKCARTNSGKYDKSLTLVFQGNSRVASKIANPVRELISEAQVY